MTHMRDDQRMTASKGREGDFERNIPEQNVIHSRVHSRDIHAKPLLVNSQTQTIQS